MKRRGLLVAGSALASSGLLTGFNFNWRRMLPPRDREILEGGPVQVPRDFVGIHFHRWPRRWRMGDIDSPAPTYRYGTVRSLNYDGVAWRDLQLAPGAYDFKRLDEWVDTHAARGHTMMFTLYGTPTWASTRPSVLDPYFYLGGDSRPIDMKLVGEFTEALVSRYNAPGSKRRIAYLEIWNEPDFHGGRYWRDTAEDLAELCREAYLAAKRADPDIVVLSPPFNDLFEGPKVFPKVVRWANADDRHGGTGGQWADEIAFHYYHYWDTNPVELLDVIEGMRMTRDAIGKRGVPMHLTEIGDNRYWEKGGVPESDKILTIRRWMALGAAAGLRMIGLYSHESHHLGEPATRPAVAAAIDEMHEILAGSTITEGMLRKDGRVEIAMANGRQYAW